MEKNKAIAKLLAVARAEVGYLEKASNKDLDSKTGNAGRNNYTKYARDLAKLGVYNGDKNGYSWCDVYADWCFIEAFGVTNGMKLLCQPMGGLGAGCRYSRDYYKAEGRFTKGRPEPGYQIFFTSSGSDVSHTGIVERVEENVVYTIEGNTSTGKGVIANGGGVCQKSYAITDKMIIGYGMPDWSILPDEDTTEEDDGMPENDNFKEDFAEMRKELQDNDAGSWSQSDRDWAIASGLMQGSGTDAKGDPNMMWQDFVTREQLAAVTHRFADNVSKQIEEASKNFVNEVVAELVRRLTGGGAQ